MPHPFWPRSPRIISTPENLPAIIAGGYALFASHAPPHHTDLILVAGKSVSGCWRPYFGTWIGRWLRFGRVPVCMKLTRPLEMFAAFKPLSHLLHPSCCPRLDPFFSHRCPSCLSCSSCWSFYVLTCSSSPSWSRWSPSRGG